MELTGRGAAVTGGSGRCVATVEVRDHGPGFPPEFLPHAFERFQRADPARGRADGGAGLGLAIVATIAHAHHGTVAAGNHPSGGARVRIELPADSWP
jgi:signal transduction histidine kinase